MTMLRRRRWFGITAFAAATTVSACGDGSGPKIGPPASVVKQGNTDAQTATVGTAVARPPSVTVRDADGNAVPGITVTFAVASGGGSVTDATKTTDANGVATVGSWTLGTTAGANTLTATVAGVSTPATFTATGTPGPAAAAAKQAGDEQQATVGTAVATPPAVRVADQYGNPVQGVTVTFAVASGGGSATGTTATTNAQGVAAVGGWTLGTTRGPNTLTATVTGIATPVTFTATGVSGAPASLAKQAGDNQQAPAGTPVPVAPSVIVRDQHGNPVPGVTVTFAVASGGGSVTGPTFTTGPDGVATVGSWRLGNTPGTNTLTATVTGGPAVTFTATGVVGAPASLAKHAGDNQSAPVGTLVPVPPSVVVRDQVGNPVPNTTVTFAVVGGGGSITGATQTTNAQGVATVGSWTLGPQPGTNTLRASVPSVPSVPPVDFVAIAVDPCMSRTNLAVPSTVSGTLTTADCELGGFLYDFYSVNVASSVMHVFSMSSTAFDTYLELWNAEGNEIFALNDDGPSSTDSRLRVLAAAGSYTVGASSFSTGSTGSYTLSAATASIDVGPCPGLDIDGMVWITRGTTTAQSLGSSDCQVGTAGSTVYADRLAVIMYAGFQYTITQTSGTFDTFLSLLDSEGTVVAANDDIAPDNSNSRIVFTPTASDVYIIEPSSFGALTTGSYTLTVQLTAGASGARDQRVGQFPRAIARPRRK